MGNIISQSDVEARLKKNYATLYTPRGESAVDTDLVDADIEGAEGIVWGYCAKRYQVPVADASALAMLKPLALAVVEELAYPDAKVPEAAAARIKRAYSMLEAIGNGTLSLGATPAPAESVELVGFFSRTGATPVMTRENLEGF